MTHPFVTPPYPTAAYYFRQARRAARDASYIRCTILLGNEEMEEELDDDECSISLLKKKDNLNHAQERRGGIGPRPSYEVVLHTNLKLLL